MKALTSKCGVHIHRHCVGHRGPGRHAHLTASRCNDSLSFPRSEKALGRAGCPSARSMLHSLFHGTVEPQLRRSVTVARDGPSPLSWGKRRYAARGITPGQSLFRVRRGSNRLSLRRSALSQIELVQLVQVADMQTEIAYEEPLHGLIVEILHARTPFVRRQMRCERPLLDRKAIL